MTVRDRELLGRLGDGTSVWSRLDEDHLVAHPEARPLLGEALASIESAPPPGEALAHMHAFPRFVGVMTCVSTTDADDIVFARRIGRHAGVSRFVRGREGIPCRTFVVWIRTTEDGIAEVATAYVGRVTPAEPWRPRARVSREAWDEAVAFWSTHALVWDGKVRATPTPRREAPEYWGDPPRSAHGET